MVKDERQEIASCQEKFQGGSGLGNAKPHAGDRKQRLECLDSISLEN